MNTDNKDPFKPARAFVQTGRPTLPELDQWPQITEGEVNMAADMTRRNELSGAAPAIKKAVSPTPKKPKPAQSSFPASPTPCPTPPTSSSKFFNKPPKNYYETNAHNSH